MLVVVPVDENSLGERAAQPGGRKRRRLAPLPTVLLALAVVFCLAVFWPHPAYKDYRSPALDAAGTYVEMRVPANWVADGPDARGCFVLRESTGPSWLPYWIASRIHPITHPDEHLILEPMHYGSKGIPPSQPRDLDSSFSFSGDGPRSILSMHIQESPDKRGVVMASCNSNEGERHEELKKVIFGSMRVITPRP